MQARHEGPNRVASSASNTMVFSRSIGTSYLAAALGRSDRLRVCEASSFVVHIGRALAIQGNAGGRQRPARHRPSGLCKAARWEFCVAVIYWCGSGVCYEFRFQRAQTTVVERSPFLRGDTGWRGGNFDWFFKKANFQKTLEGNYDN